MTMIEFFSKKYGVTSPINGSWIQAICVSLGITSPVNGSWLQALAEYEAPIIKPSPPSDTPTGFSVTYNSSGDTPFVSVRMSVPFTGIDTNYIFAFWIPLLGMPEPTLFTDSSFIVPPAVLEDDWFYALQIPGGLPPGTYPVRLKIARFDTDFNISNEEEYNTNLSVF